MDSPGSPEPENEVDVKVPPRMFSAMRAAHAAVVGPLVEANWKSIAAAAKLAGPPSSAATPAQLNASFPSGTDGDGEPVPAHLPPSAGVSLPAYSAWAPVRENVLVSSCSSFHHFPHFPIPLPSFPKSTANSISQLHCPF